MQNATTPETRVQRHPIQGAFFGAVMGVAATIYIVLFAVRPFTYELVAQVTGAGAAFGFLWGTLAPARKVKEVPTHYTSLSPVFTRSASAKDTEAPTYETTFGSPELPVSSYDDEDERSPAKVGGFFD